MANLPNMFIKFGLDTLRSMKVVRLDIWSVCPVGYGYVCRVDMLPNTLRVRADIGNDSETDKKFGRVWDK